MNGIGNAAGYSDWGLFVFIVFIIVMCALVSYGIYKLGAHFFINKNKSDLNDYIYVYYINENGQLIYDRSMSRYGAGPGDVKHRIQVLESRGFEAFYTIGTLAREAALS